MIASTSRADTIGQDAKGPGRVWGIVLAVLETIKRNMEPVTTAGERNASVAPNLRLKSGHYDARWSWYARSS